MSSARCRARSPRKACTCARSFPDIRTCWARCATPPRCTPSPTCPEEPARLLAAHSPGLDLLVLDAPQLYARPGNPYTGPDGTDWPDNALRFGALAAAAASDRARRRRRVPPPCRARARLAGRPHSRLSALFRWRRARAHGDDRAQPRVPGPVPARSPGVAAPAGGGACPSTASNITDRSDSSRAASRWPTASRRCPRPTRRRSGRPKAEWDSTASCAGAPTCCPESSTASTSTSGTPRAIRICGNRTT